MSDLDAARPRASSRDTVLPQVEAWDRADELPHAVLRGARRARPDGRARAARVRRRRARGGRARAGVAHALAGLDLADRRGQPDRAGHRAARPPRHRGAARALAARHRARATVLASFSITEPQAGSDLEPASRRRRAPLDGGGLVLDGEKRWVAGGVSSDVVFLLAEVDGARPSCVVLPGRRARRARRWEVERARQGRLPRRRVGGLPLRRATRRRAPRCSATSPGEGARQMLDALDVGRVNVACRALGILDRCLACAVEESTTREVGDGLLGEHTHAQLRIGELRRAARRGRGARRARGGRRSTRGADDARELSTAAKIVASDTAVWAVDLAARLARQPLLRGRRRARPPAPRRAADADRRGRQRRAAARARAPAAALASGCGSRSKRGSPSSGIASQSGAEETQVCHSRADAGVAVDGAEPDDHERAVLGGRR